MELQGIDPLRKSHNVGAVVISCNKHRAQFLAHRKGVFLIKSHLSRDTHPIPHVVARRKQASDSSQTMQGLVNDSHHAPSLKISMLMTSVQYRFASGKLWHVGLLGSYLLNFEHHCILICYLQNTICSLCQHVQAI